MLRHLALSVAERLLASDASDDRVRGVERLVAASGQREAIDRLLRALADAGGVLRDPRARLTAIRGLFPYASREPVRQAMEKALSTEAGQNPLLSIMRDTAAMALAASDDVRSLEPQPREPLHLHGAEETRRHQTHGPTVHAE